MRDVASGRPGVHRPSWAVRGHAGWMSRLVLFVALAFGVVSPYRAAPRVAETEEAETCGDSAKTEATHARVTNRHDRRALHKGPAPARVAPVPASVRTRTAAAVVAHPRWQLPRRSVPPDEDPLG